MIMGNAATAEELISAEELDELYRLDASESDPEDEDDDDDDDDDDEEGAEERPDIMPQG
jgi:phosphopantothenoylcysteine synthetase/decarboxylase